ncbi:MAG: hypothetical protein DWI29_04135 [Planctomycetota bacterium]|nr:MAG: hypothetical protein DWI29_04135 [Planctomycetota bacterium]
MLSPPLNVFTGFLGVPSPPGKGEKVAGGRMRGLFAGSDAIKYLTALPQRAVQNGMRLRIAHWLNRAGNAERFKFQISNLKSQIAWHKVIIHAVRNDARVLTVLNPHVLGVSVPVRN